MAGCVLLVDDDASMCEVLRTALSRRGFTVETATSAAEALRALDEHEVDVVATDLHMPGMSGIELCAHVASKRPDVPVIVLTAFGSLETAIAAIRAGAYDFILKPPELDSLVVALDRAIQTRALREEVRRLRRAVAEARGVDEMIGTSTAMRALFDMVERAAETDVSVLVTGETGSGKELVARALHRRGRRAAGPFVAINCAALPEALLESELFGHSRGAFTDAKTAHTGLFVRASGGTLLLDEIGDMPVPLQVKLLRAIQERRVRPVGGDAEVAFDVRIVSSTHRDLETAIAEGRFRQDLFFRLNVIHIDVPPLRSRPGDVLILARSFLQAFATRAEKEVVDLTSAAAERLVSYSWPGNVRELQNCMERAVALTRHERITVEDLPPKIQDDHRPRVLVRADEPTDIIPLEELERRYILRVLDVVAGNKAMAARLLGLDRATLYRRLQRYGVAGSGEA